MADNKVIKLQNHIIKRQYEEIKQLKQVNETLADRVHRITELELLVQRQEKRIKDLEARLKDYI